MFSYDFTTLAIQSSIYISFIFISLVREAQEVKISVQDGGAIRSTSKIYNSSMSSRDNVVPQWHF